MNNNNISLTYNWKNKSRNDLFLKDINSKQTENILDEYENIERRQLTNYSIFFNRFKFIFLKK